MVMPAGLQAFSPSGKLIFDSNSFKVLKKGVPITYKSYTYRNVGNSYYITLLYDIPALPSEYGAGFVYFGGRPFVVPLGEAVRPAYLLMRSTGTSITQALANLDSSGQVYYA